MVRFSTSIKYYFMISIVGPKIWVFVWLCLSNIIFGKPISCYEGLMIQSILSYRGQKYHMAS